MKFAVSVLLSCLVAACTGSSPKLPQSVQPIVGSITIGVRPVEQGQQIDATKITLTKNGQAQSMTFSTQSLVDVTRNAEELMIRLEVLDVAVDASDLDSSEVDDLKHQFGQLPGTVFTYSLNTRTKEERQKVRTDSFDVEMVQERSVGITRSIRDGYMGGLTVRQNQEIARGRLSDLFPGTDLGGLGGSISSRVVGQTVYAGRSVVAVSTDGTIEVGSATAKIHGVTFVDIASGVPLYSDALLSGLRAGDSIQDIAMSQRLTIYGS